MTTTPPEIEGVAESAKAGDPVELTPRQLLAAYGFMRRGRWNNQIIRRDLKRNGLVSEPDFEGAYIDGIIVLKTIDAPTKKGAAAVKSEVAAVSTWDETITAVSGPSDPAHRISRLKAASTKPVSVSPSDTVHKAVTFMLKEDFSQLPVMSGERTVKGMVSWRSLGKRLAMGQKCTLVQECMEPAKEVAATASMFDVIRVIAAHDAVLVRDDKNLIGGIVTAFDISDQFRTLSEPFLLLGDIENNLRHLIETRFSSSVIAGARDPGDVERTIESADDLSFGEYVRLLENPDNWTALKLPLDRGVFIADLQLIRLIRNDIMHFDPDGIDPSRLQSLRNFARFLDELHLLNRT